MNPHPLLAFSFSSLILLLSPAIGATDPVTPQREIAQKVPKARSILEAWKKGDPTNINRTLHIVYWTPADREPAPQYRERLTRCMKHIQAFYAVEMQRLGFGKQTINLQLENDNMLRIHVVKAPKPYTHYKPGDGSKIRKECLPTLKKAGIDADKETIVIFCNMSNWNPTKKRITQNSPYYAGGTHRSGTAWQVDSPLLDPIYLHKKQPIIHDGQYGHISLGKYNSIFIGGVAHELGHALGLPHNCERADEQAALEIALMGSGNRTYCRDLRGEGKGSFLTLASGLRLASHPMFTGSIKGMHLRGQSQLTNLKITPGNKAFTITGKVAIAPGSPPVHAILAYTDPQGGGDYDATTATAIPDSNGRFTLNCTDLRKSGPASLRIISLYANGDATAHVGTHSPYTYPYKVGKDQQLHLETMNLMMTFAPAIHASKRQSKADVTKTFQTIAQSNNATAAAIATRLLRKTHFHSSPGKIPATITSVELADTTPTSAKVGYLRPVYNRIPSPSMLLQSSFTLFQHGIYAHAPARHSYNLAGQWKKFSGTCGIATGFTGLTVFVIKADGKELWRSGPTKPGRLPQYNLDVTGKNSLELIVEDGGNGNRADWGLWLEPTLSR